jgi:hypothetical protein
MTLVNEVGDVVLTDPHAMRALADPAKLALLERLRRRGPANAAELSPDAQRRLEELERFGLVSRDGDRWNAVGKGFVFEVPDDREGQAAARELSSTLMSRSLDVPARWLADDERRLELDWVRAAGLFKARVRVTADELRDLQEGLERLLEPYITRDLGAAPAARHAQVVAYFLPEAGPS